MALETHLGRAFKIFDEQSQVDAKAFAASLQFRISKKCLCRCFANRQNMI